MSYINTSLCALVVLVVPLAVCQAQSGVPPVDATPQEIVQYFVEFPGKWASMPGGEGDPRVALLQRIKREPALFVEPIKQYTVIPHRLPEALLAEESEQVRRDFQSTLRHADRALWLIKLLGEEEGAPLVMDMWGPAQALYDDYFRAHAELVDMWEQAGRPTGPYEPLERLERLSEVATPIGSLIDGELSAAAHWRSTMLVDESLRILEEGDGGRLYAQYVLGVKDKREDVVPRLRALTDKYAFLKYTPYFKKQLGLEQQQDPP